MPAVVSLAVVLEPSVAVTATPPTALEIDAPAARIPPESPLASAYWRDVLVAAIDVSPVGSLSPVPVCAVTEPWLVASDCDPLAPAMTPAPTEKDWAYALRL